LLRQTINKKIDEVLKWANDNPAASKDKYDSKIKEVERLFNPIMQEIYLQAGGQPDGMPNFGGPNPGVQERNKGTATGGAEDVE